MSTLVVINDGGHSLFIPKTANILIRMNYTMCTEIAGSQLKMNEWYGNTLPKVISTIGYGVSKGTGRAW